MPTLTKHLLFTIALIIPTYSIAQNVITYPIDPASKENPLCLRVKLSHSPFRIQIYFPAPQENVLFTYPRNTKPINQLVYTLTRMAFNGTHPLYSITSSTIKKCPLRSACSLLRAKYWQTQIK